MDKLPFYVNGKIIYITLEWTRNKNMYLKIKDDKHIVCLAPIGTNILNIKKFCGDNVSNFVKYIEKKENNQLFDLQNKIIYLDGSKYKLQFLSTIDKPTYKIIDKIIYLYFNDDSEIEKIYKKILLENLEMRIKDIFAQLNLKMNIPQHTYELKYLKSKWGSNMIKDKHILISTKMAHFDNQSLEYLIVHELAHFIEPNHSDRFYDIVKRYIPNYKELRKKLKFIDDEK